MAQRGHRPVPVAAQELAHEVLRCDFCNGDVEAAVAWMLPTTPFTHGGGGFDADWLACPVCLPLIRRRRWSQIATRAIANRTREPVVRRALLELFERVEAHATGELRPRA